MQYFRRALRLNPNYLSAWTLMGHEYVELKNPPAAIGEGGRAAVLRLHMCGMHRVQRSLVAPFALHQLDVA